MNHEKDTKSNASKHAETQSLFYAAFKNAVVRFIAKNADQTLTEAEQALFMALGYDHSTESKQPPVPPVKKTAERKHKRSHKHKHPKRDRGDDCDQAEEDSDATFVYFSDGAFSSDSDGVDCHEKRRRLFYDQFNASFAEQLRLFRCDYIMRDADAIRSVRISRLFEMLSQEHNHYSDADIVLHLTQKLDALYPPSPSPPPPSPPPPVSSPSPSPVAVADTIEKVSETAVKVCVTDLNDHDDDDDEDDDLRHDADTVQTAVLTHVRVPRHFLARNRRDVSSTVSSNSVSRSSVEEEHKFDSDSIVVGRDRRYPRVAVSAVSTVNSNPAHAHAHRMDSAAPFYMAMPNIEYFLPVEVALPAYDYDDRLLLHKKRKFGHGTGSSGAGTSTTTTTTTTSNGNSSSCSKSRKRSYQCLGNFSDDSQSQELHDGRSVKRARYRKNSTKMKGKHGRSRSRKERMNSCDRMDSKQKVYHDKNKNKNASDESDLEFTANSNNVSAPQEC